MTKTDERTKLLTEFAACMPEEWFHGSQRLVFGGAVWLEFTMTPGGVLKGDPCYVRLENDLLEAPAIIAVLDWLKGKGYDTQLHGWTDGEMNLFLASDTVDWFCTAPTRIECAVKAMVYVRSLEK